MREILASRATHVDVVWSGPLVEGATARNTSDVILEMLRLAKAPGDILVVGYSLTSSAGTEMHHVVDAFLEASGRGLTLTFVLHAEGERSSNKQELMKGWHVLERKPRILTWRPRAAHAYTKMHAKALVVNRIDALVTSANLTFHGLESNLELGVRLRGEAASAIASRFDRLLATGALVPWDETARP
jgi:phosphatidylserine/phosphatidylglycerophosphate/cardiolipin synthase-like enzyme